MNKFLKIFSISIAVLSVFVNIAPAQYEDAGKLNTWTTKNIQRIYEDETASESLCKIRVAKNKGYDRVVFEFNGGKPNYVIQYLPSNIYSTDGGDHIIKIAGKVFMVVNIYGMGQLDELPCELKDYPKGNLKFQTLQEIDEGVWFEGIKDLLIGVKAKKPFRVEELTNPSRLVIDFKHK